MAKSLKSALHEAALERNIAKETEKTYFYWSKDFYCFIKKPVSQCDETDVGKYLTQMKRLDYAESSRKQALNALVFVFRHVVKKPLGGIGPAAFIKVPETPLVIPSRVELGRIFTGMKGMQKLMTQLMYGSGLRIRECCLLRVKDLDFDNGIILVYQGKGAKHRRTILPAGLVDQLDAQIRLRKAQHDLDLQAGHGLMALPNRIRKKAAGASRDFSWQWLFPSTAVRDGYRWHTPPKSIQVQFKKAKEAAGIYKRITPHNLRKAFATHMMDAGVSIRTVQELLGHTKLETTQIYTGTQELRSLRSPIDSVV